MTGSEFCLIAATLKSTRPANFKVEIEDNPEFNMWYRTVRAFFIICKEKNSRFNGEKFLEACGVYN